MGQNPPRTLVTAFAICAALAGCRSIPPVNERSALSDSLALPWVAQTVQTAKYDLRAYSPTQSVASKLTVYIEGDGLAWITRSRPSHDPTPLNPVALKLAKAQGNSAAYLARPCQFVMSTECSQSDWTAGRFSADVINAMNAGVDLLKRQHQSQELTLVGFSGGAAVALHLAEMRDDVVKVVTVGGNLDHRRWTDFHRLTPLHDSLPPARAARVHQIHFFGENDQVFPPELVSEFKREHPGIYVVLPGQGHSCCWEDAWPELAQQWLSEVP